MAKNINSGDISHNKLEISEFKFLDIPEMQEEIEDNSKTYAPWFLIALEKYNLL